MGGGVRIGVFDGAHTGILGTDDSGIEGSAGFLPVVHFATELVWKTLV